MTLNISKIRSAFPMFRRENPVVYLDSAATAQMPQLVGDAMNEFESSCRANVHRGMHGRAEVATKKYEAARCTVQKFINAIRPEEIIFTKGTTEGINTVAHSFGSTLQKGDGIVLSVLEHHSNIVPWLQLQKEREIEIYWIEMTSEGILDMDQYVSILKKENIKLLAVTGQSNVLGIRPELKKMIAMAHEVGAAALVDAAQLAAHHRIDVQDIDCDFLVFSGHKVYGPMGIGVLYGKRNMLESMPPFFGGGMMIHEVKRQSFSAADIPAKFEAGTPPITQAIGLHAALNWFQSYKWEEKEEYEDALLKVAINSLSIIEGLKIIGPTKDISGCCSFTIEGIHPHDLTQILGQKNICMRAGHHCAQPLHETIGVNATTRLSVGLYNSMEDIEKVVPAIKEAITTLTGK